MAGMVLPALWSQLAGRADTVIVRQVPPDLGWFTQFVELVRAMNAIAPWVIVALAVWMVLKLRDRADKAQASLDDVRADLKRLVESSANAAERVAEVAEAVQETVAEVKDTVDVANRRARRAVIRLADQVDELTAAMAIAQDTLQKPLVTTAAVLKGVRAGLAAFRAPPAAGRRARDEDTDADDDVPRPRLKRRGRG